MTTTTKTTVAVTQTLQPRQALRVVPAVRTVEGAGFVVRRPFPRVGLQQVDPFLLVDELGPVELAPGEAQGAPDHPHRGFETVTYVLEGETEHRDSAGNAGRLTPGDVQWMTAGGGVVHSEMPSARMQREGGRTHGFQVWVNLPRRDKRMRPRYQELKAADIPVVHTPDGSVRVKVIAGEALGARARTETRTPIAYLHVTLQPGARFTQPVPRDHQAMAYVFGGRGEVAGRAVGDGELVLLTEGDTVELHNPGTEVLELLLLSGVPLREPMVRYGPFVMNTQEELVEAFEDFRDGKMGAIPPTVG